jgi:hypothetical protein
MTRAWKVGDQVKLFDGSYSTGTIVKIHDGATADVVRPYLHAHETGGWYVGFETVTGIRFSHLVPAETDRDGNPRNHVLGCYTHEDLEKVASGEWKL